MDHYVIKGRGPNRGKYLCYARMAGLPAEQDPVWLPEQRKAMRHDHPKNRGGGWGYVQDLADKHDGYFVRLVARKGVIARVNELKHFIAEHASGAAERPRCYWLDDDWSDDEGPDYCWACACKEVDKAFAKDPKKFAELYGDQHGERDSAENYYDDAIRGGYSMDHDSMPYCENGECGISLDGTLTEYGADEQIRELTTDCTPAFDDAESWYCLDIAVMHMANDDPRWNKIARVVDAAIEQERRKVAREFELAASAGMTDARTSLLGLLAVRREQKVPEPSYRLWDEFVAWRKRDRANNDSPEHKALEKRLIAEARSFANDLGMRAYWGGGLFMIKAPYGAFYWPFVVEAEQYRLWKPKAWQEGRNAARTNRDANPYAKGSDEHAQWDCGYMFGNDGDDQ